MKLSRLLIAAAVLAVASCSASDPASDPDGAWVGTITIEGNVTTAITASGSVWGGEAQLVEEMSIGVDIGADEFMLGHVANIYATEELVYLTDPQEPAVRAYDTEGRYVRTIGSGPGQGPGEYETPVLVNGTADGTIFVYDANGRRLTAYDAEGATIDSWNLDDGACCAWRMSVAPDGTLWMPVEQPGFLSPTGEYRYGARAYGLVDEGTAGDIRWHAASDIRWHPVLEFPSLTFEVEGRKSAVPFSPAYAWTLSADGGVTVGTSDRYRFELHKIDGSKLVVERQAEPVPVHPDEAEWQRRWRVQSARNRAGPDFDIRMDIPEHKPAFIGFVPDAYGGTWVWRTGPSRHLGGDCEDDPYTTDLVTSRDNSCWVSDRFFDIFDPQGRYLGWVQQPDGLERWNAQLNLFPMGDIVYAIIETAEGVPTVKRYRLVPPEEE